MLRVSKSTRTRLKALKPSGYQMSYDEQINLLIDSFIEDELIGDETMQQPPTDNTQ